MKKSVIIVLTLLWMLLLSIDTASAMPQYHVVYPDSTEEDFYASGSDYWLRCGIAGDLTIIGTELNGSNYLHVFVGEELYKAININDTPETIYIGAGQEIYVDFISNSATYKTLHFKADNPTPAPTPITPTAVFGETPYEAKPLPEDEIGTYSFDEYGNKFYIQFHSYDICMRFMNDENLCRNTSTNLYNF